jgi:YfiH family protein
MLTHGAWTEREGLHHGFLGRAECAERTDWGPVVARATGTPLLVATARQVHGATTVTATRPGAGPEADALATTTPGIAVGVVTADCVPVLLVDPSRRVAAAVHAGWRGAAAGILGAAVAHLAQQFGTGPAAVEAAIGPAIAGCCYEVGAEVADAFRASSGDTTAAAWSERRGRRFVDLRVAARLLLQAAGVERTALVGPCTACGAGYHSYRRDGAGVGRQLSFVGWA